MTDWRKRFSLGLVLDTKTDEFEAFLKEYHPYIDNFYFSLPLGNRFHARRRVATQLQRAETIRQFWEQLALIRQYGIRLEVLFNTRGLTAEDVLTGKQLLEAHRITPEKVGLVDSVYETVRACFPRQQLVYSFNNFPAAVRDFGTPGHVYDEYVLGRQFIRSTEAMRFIREELHGRTVLLVNNGCSHVCGGCGPRNHCFQSHQASLEKHSAEYLYALQSILPYELHENLIDMSMVDLIKINSRNATMEYLRQCLESYLSPDEEQRISKSKESWGLWAHLTWHGRAYDRFDFARIKAIKEKIYHHEKIEDDPEPWHCPVWLDFTHKGIQSGKSGLPKISLEEAEKAIKPADGVICGAVLGVTGCPHLLKAVDITAAAQTLREAKALYGQTAFALPPLEESELSAAAELIHRITEKAGVEPDLILAGDPKAHPTLSKALGLPIRHPVYADAAEKSGNCRDRNAFTVISYPMKPFVRGVCPQRDRAFAEKDCTAPCLDCLGRSLKSDVQGARVMTLVGDTLYRRYPFTEYELKKLQCGEAAGLLQPEALSDHSSLHS